METCTLEKQPAFSKVLHVLMKKYNISGQKIAERVGKSQKTISRYSTGSVTPKVEVQKKILQAIADIGGYSIDQIFSEVSELSEKCEVMLLGVDEAKQKMRLKQKKETQNQVLLRFGRFPKETQEFILRFFDVFAELNLYEMEMIDNFHSISEAKRNVILEIAEYLANKGDIDEMDATLETQLENYRIQDYEELCAELEKKESEEAKEKANKAKQKALGKIEETEAKLEKKTEENAKEKAAEEDEEEPIVYGNSRLIMYDENDPLAVVDFAKTELEEMVKEKLESKDLELGQLQRLALRLVDMVKYTAEDVRFLSYVQRIHLWDKTGENYTRDYQMIGDSVYMLACSLEKMAEQKERHFREIRLLR